MSQTRKFWGLMTGALLLCGCAGGAAGPMSPQWMPPRDNLAEDARSAPAMWKVAAVDEVVPHTAPSRKPAKSKQGDAACDDAAEKESAQSMQERRMAQIQALPLNQQECAVAHMKVDMQMRSLTYAKRCNRTTQLPAMEEALANSRAMVERACQGGNVPA